MNIIGIVESLLNDLEKSHKTLKMSAAINDVGISVKDGKVEFDINAHVDVDKTAFEHIFKQTDEISESEIISTKEANN